MSGLVTTGTPVTVASIIASVTEQVGTNFLPLSGGTLSGAIASFANPAISDTLPTNYGYAYKGALISKGTTQTATTCEQQLAVTLSSITGGNNGAGADAIKVALFSGLYADQHAGDGWAFNPIVYYAPTLVRNGKQKFQTIEVDVANDSGSFPNNFVTEWNTGLSIAASTNPALNGGVPYLNTAAIFLSGPAGGNGFHWGIFSNQTAVNDGLINHNGNTTWTLVDSGNHTWALDFLGAISSAALRTKNATPIIASQNAGGTATIEVARVDASSNAVLGLGAVSVLMEPSGQGPAFQILPAPASATAANHWYAQPAATGLTPTLGIVGTDANPNGVLLMQGLGSLLVENSFGFQGQFATSAAATAEWPSMHGSAAGGGAIYGAAGSGANINVGLVPKGTGSVVIGAPLSLSYSMVPYTGGSIGPVPAPIVNVAALSANSPASGTTGNAFVAVGGQMAINSGTTINSGGHVVGALGWAALNGGTTPLMIGIEGKLDLLSGTVGVAVMGQSQVNQIDAGVTISTALYGHEVLLQNAAANIPLFAAYPIALTNAPAAGTTIATLAGMVLQAPASIAGSIGTIVTLWQPNWSGVAGYSNIGPKYVLLNQDPGFVLQTSGQILGAYGDELVPQHPGLTVGNYYFGIAPSPTLSTLTIAGTLAYVTEVFIPARTIITKVGCEITTAVSGHNLQMAIYKMAAGIPTGSPLWTGANHSTAATGVIEETISLTIEGGVYALCVLTDGTGVALRSYTDTAQAAQLGFNGSNTTAADLLYFAATLNSSTPASTWVANPAVGRTPGGGVYPQVWVRP